MTGSSPPPRPERRFQPGLAMTISASVLAMICFLALISGLVLPRLTEIAASSEATYHHYLPTIMDNHRHAVKVETLGNYLNTLYWADDARIARNLRLRAQVLIQGFTFENDRFLEGETLALLGIVREIENIRTEQGELLAEMHGLVRTLDLAAVAGSGEAGHGNGLAGSLRALNHTWGYISGRLHGLGPLPTPAGEVRSQLAVLHTQLDQLQPLAGSTTQAANLQAAMIRMDTLAELLTLHEALSQRAASLLSRGNEHYERMADHLSVDAALKVKELSARTAEDAGSISRYIHGLILTIAITSLLALWALHVLVLRPIQQAVEGLHAIHRQGGGKVRLPAALFIELDMIRHAVEDYATLTEELRSANSELQKRSEQDGLTGLANRGHFDDALLQAIHRARRHGSWLTLMMLDIDHFKRLNDTYGHLTGDNCLRSLAHVLQHYSQRADELASRYGGEEFTLLLPGVERDEALRIAERVRQDCAELQVPRADGTPGKVSFTLSIGVASCPGTRLDTPTHLIQLADKALYAAKHGGRNQVCEASGNTAPAPAPLPTHTVPQP